MPHTLLLRFSAPMQSWGVSSRFTTRDSAKEPTKSGVIGLLCAALGISRDNANSDDSIFTQLLKLRMGVRVLSEGILEKDYHIALNVSRASGVCPKRDKDPKHTVISNRYYLSDANFLVALESENHTFLESIQKALEKPKWHLFLGRKAFVPAEPIFLIDGIRLDTDFENALRSFVLDESEMEGFSKKQRLIIEDEDGMQVCQDVPLDLAERRFGIRRVRMDFMDVKK